ncbi:MAG: bacteriohemerythrin [Acetivibrionales bacterium]|mgnify:CR=1 FL=1|jgi:hemerythrin|nr:hemerythrin family protein [Clostridiaceae bacterium]
MIIKWKPEFSCYDSTIDEQHKKMIDMINEMNDLSLYDDHIDRYDSIVEVFGRLKDYTVYHFNHEEKLFEEHGYDSFNTKIQKLEHKGFVNKVTSINLYDLDENQNETIMSVLDFLSKWLEHHILDIDRKFGEFLREKYEK